MFYWEVLADGFHKLRVIQVIFMKWFILRFFYVESPCFICRTWVQKKARFEMRKKIIQTGFSYHYIASVFSSYWKNCANFNAHFGKKNNGVFSHRGWQLKSTTICMSNFFVVKKIWINFFMNYVHCSKKITIFKGWALILT